MLRKLCVLFVILLICGHNAYAAKSYPPNQMPMYGGAKKTPAMVEADNKLFQSMAEKGHSRQEASIGFTKTGWKYFTKKDYATAMKRFNQAWLMDSKNYEPYWGFALISMLRDGNKDVAETYFEKALDLEPTKANFYVEYGRFCDMFGKVDKATELFEEGLKRDPSIRDGYVGLIRCYSRKLEADKFSNLVDRGIKAGVFTDEEKEELLKMQAEIVQSQ